MAKTAHHEASSNRPAATLEAVALSFSTRFVSVTATAAVLLVTSTASAAQLVDQSTDQARTTASAATPGTVAGLARTAGPSTRALHAMTWTHDTYLQRQAIALDTDVIAAEQAAQLAADQLAADQAAADQLAADNAAAAQAAEAAPKPAPKPVTQPAADGRPRHEIIGEQALAKIRFIDISGLGWTVDFHEGRDGYLGLADWETNTMHVWVRDTHTVQNVLGTIAHEMTHVLDYDVWTDDIRQQWMDMRGMDADWYPACSCDDRSFGAGDIAEAVVILEAGVGEWTGHNGPVTQAQLDWLRTVIS